MKIAEVKVARKVWEIVVLTNRYGNKFVIAKAKTIYDTVLEVHLEKMPDGVVIAHEIRNNLLEDDELSRLRKELIRLREQYCVERKW